MNGFISVPTEPPTNIEAVLLNSSAVHLKWKPPLQYALNGVLKSYQVIFFPLLLRLKKAREISFIYLFNQSLVAIFIYAHCSVPIAD